MIITNGAVEVMALDGDDLVCVTRNPGLPNGVSILLGPGADRLKGSSHPEYFYANDEVAGATPRHGAGGPQTRENRPLPHCQVPRRAGFRPLDDLRQGFPTLRHQSTCRRSGSTPHVQRSVRGRGLPQPAGPRSPAASARLQRSDSWTTSIRRPCGHRHSLATRGLKRIESATTNAGAMGTADAKTAQPG